MGGSENEKVWRIGTLNVHSLMNKTSGVLDHLEDNQCDICLVQETYLKNSDTAKVQEIRECGWDIYSSPRAERSGGGIGVLYRNGVRVRLSPTRKTFKSFQVQEVLIGTGEGMVRLCNIYRPPYTGKARFTAASFLEEFVDYLSDLNLRTGSPVLMGDFNFQVQDISDFYAEKFLKLLDSFGLEQLTPCQPTHTRGGTLDLVICQSEIKTKFRSVKIQKEGTESDHYMVLSELVTETEDVDFRTKQQVDMYRDFKSVDPELFRQALRNLGLEDLLVAESPEENFQIYERTLGNLVEKSVELKKRRRGKKLRPWREDESVKDVLKLRRRAERAWRKNKTPIRKAQFNDLKRQFGKVDKDARIGFNKKNLEESKDDPKGLQRKVNRLLGKAESILPESGNDRKLAEDFAEFFSNKVDKIRTSVCEEQSDLEDGEALRTDPECKLVQFEEVSVEYIKGLIKDMPDKTCDLDIIPTWLVKGCIHEFAPWITTLVNGSIRSSTVPEAFQQALVFPTIKNAQGDRDSLQNYRPVSNLLFISKVLEKVVLDQLTRYLEDNSLLNKNQSGYRVGHSCETLLTGMFEDLLEEMDRGNVMALLLLDMSAAFDTVDHSMLVQVLNSRFGICGAALNWFESYLGSRSYRVNVRGNLSGIVKLVCGVPQGSLLGPVLFLLYVEELQDLVERYGLRIKLYADDSQLYMSLVPHDDEGWIAVKGNTEDCLKKVKDWMVKHWLRCNEAKTELLLLGKSGALEKLAYEPSIVFGGTEIFPVDFKGTTGKTLGVYLDSQLTMERQVNSVKRQCGMIMRNLWQINRCLDRSMKILLVKQLVISRLDYCNILYCGLPKKHINSLQKTLNSCVRFVYGLHGHQDDYAPYLKEMHVLPIEQRIVFKACLTAYKVVHRTAPDYLTDKVPAYEDVDSLRFTRANAVLDEFRLQYPKLSSVNANSKLRRRRPSVFLPSLWNDLPLDIRSLPSVDSFKTRLKTRLFTEAYGVSIS